MSSNIRIQRICEYCNKDFTAKTTRTKYCSHLCNSRAYKANLKNTKIVKSNNETLHKVIQPIEQIKNKEFLSVKEVANLLGFSAKTVYRLIERQNINALNLSERLTRIKRTDINELFISIHPIQAEKKVTSVSERFEIDNYYTIKEVLSKFKIAESTLRRVIVNNNIEKIKKGKFVFVSKQKINKALG